MSSVGFVDAEGGRHHVGGANPAEHIADIVAEADRRRARRKRVESLRLDAAALDWNADYLGQSTVTQAEVVQQVRRLTLECTGIIRLFGALVAELADLLDDEEVT